MPFAYTILYVPDVERAAAFYESVFGLEREFTDPEGNFLGLRTGDTTLTFARRDFVSARGLRFRPVTTEQDPPGIEIGFVVDDVEATFQKAVDAGATPWFEPAAQPWGQTVSYVRDPSGFLVEIASRPGAP